MPRDYRNVIAMIIDAVSLTVDSISRLAISLSGFGFFQIFSEILRLSFGL